MRLRLGIVSSQAERCFEFLKKKVEGEDACATPGANNDTANTKTECRSRFTVENLGKKA